MNKFEQITDSPGDEPAQEGRAFPTDAKSLVYDFKLAIGILVAISLTIQLLLHLFVPGM